jgi:hypothetical protein
MSQKRNRKIASAAKKRDGYCCQVCTAGSALRTHHIIPLCVGGQDVPTNMTTYCLECHNQEHSVSGSAPISILIRIGQGKLPYNAILTSASWIGTSGCTWTGYPSIT